ncbi:MAG: gliding motility-associated C-terminal domain-containing protein [Flavobacteriales bacterium]|nr:gliding motility-associated C-terminal domain-containing protein [Flavobacteriales bacterium]
MPEALDVADDGSILATGSFYQSIDPDPGPGTNTLTSTNYAMFFAKYSANGDHLWSKALTEIGIYGGPRSIRSSPDGTILLGGHFAGDVDFDPGPGTNVMTSTSWVNDAFISKYDTDGNLIWSLDLPVLNNADGDAVELAVADDGSFAVLGDYVGIGLDLDPGPGVVTLPSLQLQNSAFVGRFNADGELLWGGGIYLFTKPWQVELDQEGNVYISGSFASGDFDLGPGVTYLITPAQSAFADVWAKYDPDGDLCWARTMGNNGYGGSTIPPAFGVKGTTQFLAGSFKQTADLDPGPDTASFTSSTNGCNAYIARFDGDAFHVDLGEDRALCMGQTLVLDPQADGASLTWQDGSTGPTYLVTDSGLYHVSTGEGGCLVTDSVMITVVDCSTYIEMPNVFSPNGDGENDRFVPVRMNGVATAHLDVFNRWGQRIFSTDRIAVGWGGASEGSAVPDGVYFWALDYRFKDAADHAKLHGSVTLVR